MAPSEVERLAVVEEQIRGLRDDVQALVGEQGRTRERLHSLESTTQGMAKIAEGRAEEAARQAVSTQRWIRVLTLVVAIAGVLGPLVYANLGAH